MTAADFNLERFVTAQAPVFATVLAELRAGRKRTHWMWFIFPQLAGLGRSSTARFYGIRSIDEARAYLGHPLLGPRLDLCTRIVPASEISSLHAIFGSPDDMKFRSCMTLFSLATDDPDNPFSQALERWCSGRPDEQTRALIDPGGGWHRRDVCRGCQVPDPRWLDQARRMELRRRRLTPQDVTGRAQALGAPRGSAPRDIREPPLLAHAKRAARTTSSIPTLCHSTETCRSG